MWPHSAADNGGGWAHAHAKKHTTELRRWCRTHAHTHACMRTHMRVHGSPASRQPVQLFKILTQIIYTHSCQRPTKKKEKTKCDCAICAFVFVHQVVRLVGIFICSRFCWFLNCCCCCSLSRGRVKNIQYGIYIYLYIWGTRNSHALSRSLNRRTRFVTILQFYIHTKCSCTEQLHRQRVRPPIWALSQVPYALNTGRPGRH